MGVIRLNRSLLIGKGSSRVCYRHPEDEGKCVKVERHVDRSVTAEELCRYRRLQKRGISWGNLARYHGDVETDQGPGAVFDMPLDADGSVSRTLHYYLVSGEADGCKASEMAESLIELKQYLLEHAILVREIKPENMVYRRMGSGECSFVLVDGIGNNQFLPVACYVKRLARRVIGRKWATFERDLSDLYPESMLAKAILRHLR
ncbi:PhoP regulatory network protein YrbL [Chlorobium phaeovibrioides]|uniref:PhoP regulatory network protein YrbL n=1 Tax=Chlorobium phaeovibrioides TaxID=1094 RepID=A0A432AU53_CHLPH|nr:PhoP regulatory network protein YrbL [Chlorobium phaeovibrioides]MWV54674.1 PhoP regulatory network protein YrbL [Chlorobium phaeovibrioides]QEQ57172.1 PhoP regulatory network protein YrbL [Chlorobium phaeovibrioides]RTY36815.1 PhoP regulatory network protein YrbL [Chlorobium phaeovibrioides]